MSRQTETIDFTVSPVVLREVERIAKAERRPGSSVFRDMVKAYKDRRKQQPSDIETWVAELIEEAQEEQQKNPQSPNSIAAELKAFAQDFATRGKARGITSKKDVDRLIHEIRKR